MGVRIAIFGQAEEAREVLVRLLADGHAVVGVYAPPAGARPDPLAAEAEARGLPLFRHARFRRRGAAIPEIVEQYEKLGAELNVLPYTTVILPLEVLGRPRLGSLCRHPSLLPRYRGGAAIGWQIIEGERETGVSVFQPDAGIDSGPIVVQKGGVPIDDTDNAARLYYEKLKPLGVEATVEAVRGIAGGTITPVPQDESKATFQPLLDDSVARIDWSRPAQVVDRLVRGCDPQPGAHALRNGERVRLYDARRLPGEPPGEPPGTVLDVGDAGATIALSGGRLQVRRVRVGSGGKVAAAESGIARGDRLETPSPA